MTTLRRFHTSPLMFVGGALLLIAVLGGCKSQAQLDADRASAEGTPLPTATLGPASPASSTPDVYSTPATSESPLVRYVAKTGGDGVSLRSDCRSEARVAGAWPEGARVEVVESGTGACAGWTLAVSDATETWVSNRYLSADRPQTSGGGTGGGTNVSATPPSSSGTPATPPSITSGAPGEFVPAGYEFVFDQYGFPSLIFTMSNISPTAIVEFVVDICLFDAAGQPVEEHGSGPTCFRSTHADVSVAAGSSYTPPKITTFAWDEARIVTITPWFSQTASGGFWRP